MNGYVVIGIPARNEAATVAGVARVALEGLRRLAVPGCVVLAENGSSDGTVAAFADATSGEPSAVLRAPRLGTGKGTNVFSLIDFALERDADRLVLLDADLRSSDPSWVERLAGAVDRAGAALAAPVYQRDRYEAGTTNHLVTPLLAALLDARVQQPIGGEFAMNAAFLRETLAWHRPASSQLYGVDVWLTANALMRGHTVCEVPLEQKLHRSPFTNVLRLPQQVVDSLLHVVAGGSTTGARSVEPAPRASVTHGSGLRQPGGDVQVVLERVRGYLRDHEDEVLTIFPSVRSVPRGGATWSITTSVWPTVLAEAVTAMSTWSYARTRDHLIALYVMRLVSFWTEIDGLSAPAIENLLGEQIEETTKTCAQAVVEFSSLVNRPDGPFDPGLWA